MRKELQRHSEDLAAPLSTRVLVTSQAAKDRMAGRNLTKTE